jgi:hypothetical protein
MNARTAKPKSTHAPRMMMTLINGSGGSRE